MRISLDWLREFVPLKLAPDELAQRLTFAGLEVEAIDRPGEALTGVTVGRVRSSERHPNADHLTVCIVDAGHGERLTIVCGASNFKPGDTVALARPGTVLPGGRTLERATIRGVESDGMLCSAKELRVGDDAAGILVLAPDAAIGAPVAAALGLDDAILDVNVTPNRPDCLSHRGIAREVAALTGVPLEAPRSRLREDRAPVAKAARVRIEDPIRCPRYAARVVEGVRVGASPRWVRRRLEACGFRPINNAVDATNYVLLELGHPLHAFDLDRVAGAQIVVRTARAGERLSTLDGVDRALDREDLVIADRDRPSAFAGIMGGASSEIAGGTARILIESAVFAPLAVRRTATRHGMRTEASQRFERGADIGMVTVALDRCAGLVAKLCGGRVLKGRIDVHPGRRTPKSVSLRVARVGALLGAEVPAAECLRIYRSLGLSIGREKAGRVEVRIPSHRVDLTREEDLVEEVARIRGYDRVPSSPLPGVPELEPESSAREVERRLRAALAASGFDEAVNYAFLAEADLLAMNPDGGAPAPIRLKNPISADLAVMRTCLLPGLLANLRHSRRRQVEDLRFYEIGSVFSGGARAEDTGPAVERRGVAGVVIGRRQPRGWAHDGSAADFYDAKGALETALESLGVGGAAFAPADAPHLHPRSACAVMAGDRRLGTIGEVHPATARHFELPGGVFGFELSLDRILAACRLTPTYRGTPRFPAVLRDVAVVVADEVPAERVRRAIASVELVDDVVLFDVYRGSPIPVGKKNLAYAIRYRRPDRTLTDDEANAAHAAIVERLAREFGAQLRDT